MNEKPEQQTKQALGRIERSLTAIKWLILLLIAAVAFPDIAWFIFVLTGSILVISLLVSGLSTIINEIRN